jgi:translation initiation factor 2 beta subunit (eIF-2beta)/eIF-5
MRRPMVTTSDQEDIIANYEDAIANLKRAVDGVTFLCNETQTDLYNELDKMITILEKDCEKYIDDVICSRPASIAEYEYNEDR